MSWDFYLPEVKFEYRWQIFLLVSQEFLIISKLSMTVNYLSKPMKFNLKVSDPLCLIRTLALWSNFAPGSWLSIGYFSIPTVKMLFVPFRLGFFKSPNLHVTKTNHKIGGPPSFYNFITSTKLENTLLLQEPRFNIY